MAIIGFVYLWINRVNGKKYVGAHIGQEDDGYVGSGVVFKRAVAKYGIEAFERKILHRECGSVESLFRREFEIINELNAVFSSEYYNLSNYDPKFTSCANGVKHRVVTDETRERIRAAAMGRKASDETKLKMSRKRRGRPSPTRGMKGLTSGVKNGNWGKSWYNKSGKNKLFVRGKQPDGWNLGRISKMSGCDNPFFGKKHTQETIDKLRAARAGQNVGDKNPFFGRHHTSETRKKMQTSWEKRRLKNENNK